MISGPLHDRASDPSVIGTTIVEAVQAPRPKTRYFAGYYARTVLQLRRMLSDLAFDSIIARSMNDQLLVAEEVSCERMLSATLDASSGRLRQKSSSTARTFP